MTFQWLSIAAIVVVSIAGAAHRDVAHAALDATAVAGVASDDQAAMLAYRQYVKEQADLLVGMSRVLAREIRDGNVDAAQAAYAPAHRYLARIEAVARMLPDLFDGMDARADAYEGRETDPRFSGFHRIEYGLFANRSTAALALDAERLLKGARALQGRIMLVDTSPAVMADAAARLMTMVADERLAGTAERYSKTDLWDIEADVEGVRQIVAMLQAGASAPNRNILAQTAVQFAAIDALLDKHKDGCGFKAFDEISGDDKAALKVPVAALAEELASLRGASAME